MSPVFSSIEAQGMALHDEHMDDLSELILSTESPGNDRSFRPTVSPFHHGASSDDNANNYFITSHGSRIRTLSDALTYGEHEKFSMERRRINSWDISDSRYPKEAHNIHRSISAPVLAFDLEKRGEANVLRRPPSDAFDMRDRAQSILKEEMLLSKLAEDTFRVAPTEDDSDDENALLG